MLNGFLPSLKNQLVLKEIKTADLELWAKRVEKLNYVQKSVSTVESESNVCKARTICTKCIRLFCEDCSKIHAKHFSDHELYIVKFETIYDVYCLSHGDPLIMFCEACSSYICVVCRYLTCSTHDVE